MCMQIVMFESQKALLYYACMYKQYQLPIMVIIHYYAWMFNFFIKLLYQLLMIKITHMHIAICHYSITHNTCNIKYYNINNNVIL